MVLVTPGSAPTVRRRDLKKEQRLLMESRSAKSLKMNNLLALASEAVLASKPTLTPMEQRASTRSLRRSGRPSATFAPGADGDEGSAPTDSDDDVEAALGAGVSGAVPPLHARRPSVTLSAAQQDRASHLGPPPRRTSLATLARHGRGAHGAHADVDFEDMLSSVARFNRETCLGSMRRWADDDVSDGFVRRSRAGSVVSVPGVRVALRLRSEEDSEIRNLDAEEVQEKINEMYALREMQCVRPGIGEKGRWHYQGAGAKVARGEIASVKRFPLPTGRRHKDLRRRVHKLQVAQRNWQITKLGRAEILGGDDVSAAASSSDDDAAAAAAPGAAAAGGGGDDDAPGGLGGGDAFVECRVLIGRLRAHESEENERTRARLGKLHGDPMSLATDAAEVAAALRARRSRDRRKRSGAAKQRAAIGDAEKQRAADETMEEKRARRLAAAAARDRAAVEAARREWVDVVTLARCTLRLRGGWRAVVDARRRRQEQAGFAMIRARFRVPLARWRRRVARNTLRWFLGRLHTIEAFRKAIKTYFRVVRMVQGTWRRRTLRVRASLRLCKVQWDRVFFSRPDVSEPLPDQIIDRALRNLIHSVHNQTTKKFGKLFGASILDKQENLFPTKELVAVWKSTSGMDASSKTSNLSISVKSKSIRLIFGRIDCSRRVLEEQPKSLRRNCRICVH